MNRKKQRIGMEKIESWQFHWFDLVQFALKKYPRAYVSRLRQEKGQNYFLESRKGKGWQKFIKEKKKKKKKFSLTQALSLELISSSFAPRSGRPSRMIGPSTTSSTSPGAYPRATSSSSSSSYLEPWSLWPNSSSLLLLLWPPRVKGRPFTFARSCLRARTKWLPRPRPSHPLTSSAQISSRLWVLALRLVLKKKKERKKDKELVRAFR